MNNMLRRTLSMIVCAAMLLSGIPAWGEQEDAVQVLQMVQSAMEPAAEPEATAVPEEESAQEDASLEELIVLEEAPAEELAEEETPAVEDAEIPAEEAAAEDEIQSIAADLQLNAYSHVLGLYDSWTLSVVLPEGEENTVGFASSDEKIAVVDANGKITALGLGSADITVSVGEKTSVCNVTVVAAPTGVTLAADRTLLGVGESIDLTTTVLPEDAATTLIYASTNPNVATVDENGKVVAVGFGVANVAVATHNGKYAMLRVIVWNAPAELTITADRTVLGVGEELQLGYTFDAYKTGAVEFSTSDADIAEITDSGLLVPKKAGKVVVTATAYNGVSGEMEFEIKNAPSKIELNAETHKMGWRDSWTLEATLPEGEAGAITYESSDPAILTVDANGKVYANWIGTVTITAKTYNGVEAACEITAVVAPSSVWLTADRTLLGVGESIDLTTTVLPEGAETTLIYASTNSNVATVDANGRVEAVGFGVANIAVATHNGKYRALRIIVWNAPEEVNITADRTVLGVGEEIQLGATFDLYKAGSVTYSSKDESIATITDSGLLTAQKEGKVTIVATAHNGVTGELEFEVKKAPSKLSLNAETYKMGWRDSWTLEATLSEGEAGAITYESSNPIILTVDANGKVYANWIGTETITARTYNGIVATCEITATVPPSAVTLTAERTLLGVGEKMQLNPTVLPEGAETTLIYASTNPNVVTVDENGMMEAVGFGVANVAVATHNGKYRMLRIIVWNAPEEVNITADRTVLGVGEEIQLGATFDLYKAGSVTYSSKDESIATITDSGLLTAQKEGKVTIVATAHNGVTGELEFEVKKAPSKLSLNAETYKMGWRDSWTLEATLSEGEAGAITYESSNPIILTVDANGKVYANWIGTETITVRTYNGVEATCEITAVVAPSSVWLTAERTLLGVGEKMQLNSTVLPVGAETTLIYASANPNVVTVDENGMMEAVGFGVANVAVATHNGKYRMLRIIVWNAPEEVTLSAERTVLGVGEEIQVNHAFDLYKAGSVSFDTDNEAIAEISDSGLLIAKATGKVKVIATTHNGKIGTLEFEIKNAPTKIELNKTTQTLGWADSWNLVATLPENEAGAITYESSNPVILPVDANGKVFARWLGTATITAKAYNEVVASCEVTVVVPPTAVTLTADTYTIAAGESLALTANVLPEGAASTLKYITGNPAIATVDENGVVTGVSEGWVAIAVITHNGKVRGVGITVTKAPDKVTLKADRTKLAKGEEMQLSGSVTNGLSVQLVYSSSNEKVATVDENGVVKAVGVGSATITGALAVNNEVSDAIEFEVVAAPTKITPAFTQKDVRVGAELTLGYTTDNGNVGAVTFKSSDETVAKVSAEGKITALKTGTAKITVSSYAEGVSATATVNVHPAPTAIALSGASVVYQGATASLTAKMTPEDAIADLTYTSSDKTVATVDQNGVVTGVKSGTATITVAADNGVSASLQITVEEKPVSFKTSVNADGSLTITGLDQEYSGVLVIPATIDGKQVTAIGASAFSGNDSLTGVVLSDGITQIGENAFADCAKLTTVTLPESVESIGSGAFSGCSALKEINLEDTAITAVNEETFQDCTALTGVTLPESVTTIGARAFENCEEIGTLVVPEEVTSLGADVFKGCTNVKLLVSEGSIAESYAKDNGVTYDDVSILIPAVKNIAVTNRVDEVGETALWTVTVSGGAGDYSYQYQVYRNGKAYNDPSDWTTANTFTFTFTEGGHYTLYVGAKDSAGDVSPYVSGGVINIGGYSESTGFRFVVFTDDTIMITGMSDVPANLVIPEQVDGMTVEAIGEYAFVDRTMIESVTLPATITEIGVNAFKGCSKMTSINLPAGLTSIGMNAFNGCSVLTGVTLPEGLETLGEGAFIECDALTAIAVPDSVTTLGDRVFAGCDNLASASLPAGLTTVNTELFNGCKKLAAITIPAGATAIQASAFAGCESLGAVTVPASVKIIGEGAFSGCSSLKTLTLNEGLVEISATAFYQNSSLTSLKLPSTVTYVRAQAFYGCKALKTVELSSKLQRINNWTFYGCAALTSIAIPASVDLIGDYAFSDCTALATATVAEGSKLTSIGQSAFYKCAALTGLQLPGSVTEIGALAFDSCSAMTSINLEDTAITEVSNFAFQNCSSLKSITVPDGVVSVGVSAFAECSGLTAMNLPDSVTSIAYHAFYGCTGLKTIYVPGAVTEIGEEAFDGMSDEFILAVIDGSVAYKYAEANDIPYGLYEGSLVFESYLYTANSGAGSAVVNAYTGDEASVVVPATINGLAVVEIGEGAFAGNTALTTIDLPDSVTVIGARAFANCTNLVSMI